MKRSEALKEIRQAGWHNDTTAAAIIQVKNISDPPQPGKRLLTGRK
jgi:hypothetical protein